MAVVRYEDATRIYPGTQAPAVQRLNLTIEDGEFLVLVGPSGSGKSTALRMLAGLEACDEGAIWIGERDVTLVQPKDRDVAMVFQSYALYPHMTVAQNIGFPLKQQKVLQGRSGDAGARGGAHPGPGRLPGPQAQAALGRPAPARGHGPCHRAEPPGLPHG